MSTPAHIISGAYLGVVAGNIAPQETAYIFTALISGGILDLDHLYYFIKDWPTYRKHGFVGKMHNARSIFHELFGLTLAAIIMFLISLFDLKLAYVIGIPFMIHIIEDMIMGKSRPFAPFDQTEIVVFPQNIKLKVGVDILIIITFGYLWIAYLNAA